MFKRTLADLTEREFEVLKLVVAGLTNREIANLLSITEKTVETHLRNIGKKWDVRRRAAMVTAAVLAGLDISGLSLRQDYLHQQ